MRCACCGHPLTEAVRDPKIVLEQVRMSPMARRVGEALARRFGRYVPPAELIDTLYADDPDGGPETARVAVAHHVRRLTRALIDTPLIIDAKQGVSGGRRLVWRDISGAT